MNKKFTFVKILCEGQVFWVLKININEDEKILNDLSDYFTNICFKMAKSNLINEIYSGNHKSNLDILFSGQEQLKNKIYEDQIILINRNGGIIPYECRTVLDEVIKDNINKFPSYNSDINVNIYYDFQENYGISGILKPDGVFLKCDNGEHGVLANEIPQETQYKSIYFSSLLNGYDLNGLISIPPQQFKKATLKQNTWMKNNYMYFDSNQKKIYKEFKELGKFR